MSAARRRSPLRPAALAATALAAAALLSSCDVINSWFNDEFADYRDEGVNFIAARGFSEANIDRSTAGYQTPALWTWAWRNDSHADDATGYSYMTIVPGNLIGTAPSGLSASSPVYRLTLVNLVAGGDFASGLPAAWTADATPAGASRAIVADATAVHGAGNNSLAIATGDKAGVRFDLDSLLDHDDSAKHNYTWVFFNNASDVYSYQLVDYSTALADCYQDAATKNNNGFTRVNIDFSNIGESPQQTVLFGKDFIGNLVIDDLRVFRTDIKDNSCLRLRLRPADTSPALIQGHYEFSVWARKPSELSFASEAGAAAPYAAETVTLWMGSPSGSDGSCSLTASITSADWTRITLRQAEGGNFQALDPDSLEPQIELKIFPFNIESPEPGAVEIAQPELRFYLDGY